MTDATIKPSRDHFANLVQTWSDFGPPLRPSPVDTAALERVLDTLGPVPRVAVLGLTPEIIGCRWPADTDLTAIDHSPAMMRELWPPERGPAGARAILADWCAMPLESGSVDLVAGDGCYIALAYPNAYLALTREVVRVLKPGGKFVIRVFIRPDQLETLAQIAAALRGGAIHSVHALKLRLHAALHGASGVGTRLDDVWRAWKELPSIPPQLQGRRGWSPQELAGIEAYRGQAARYYLPTLAEFRALASPLLTELDCAFGDYELADRCPTLVFQSKK